MVARSFGWMQSTAAVSRAIRSSSGIRATTHTSAHEPTSIPFARNLPAASPASWSSWSSPAQSNTTMRIPLGNRSATPASFASSSLVETKTSFAPQWTNCSASCTPESGTASGTSTHPAACTARSTMIHSRRFSDSNATRSPVLNACCSFNHTRAVAQSLSNRCGSMIRFSQWPELGPTRSVFGNCAKTAPISVRCNELGDSTGNMRNRKTVRSRQGGRGMAIRPRNRTGYRRGGGRDGRR